VSSVTFARPETPYSSILRTPSDHGPDRARTGKDPGSVRISPHSAQTECAGKDDSLFRKCSVNLSEQAYRRIWQYAPCIGASIDQAAEYALNEWMTLNGDQIVGEYEAMRRMQEGKARLQIVYRNHTTPGRAS
jgi:hypothetical protein